MAQRLRQQAEKQTAKTEAKTKEQAKADVAAAQAGQKQGIVVRIGKGVGNVVNKFFAAGRETIDMVIKNILPFMAFTATLLGIISASGLGDIIANTIAPLCGTLPGMLVISFICGLPFLSPILGPGAVIAQVVVLCLERSLQQELFLLSMHFAHYSQSMHRLVETSYRLDFHLEKQSQRQLSLVFRLYCLSV